MSTARIGGRVGPMRRGGSAAPDHGLNYAAIGASASPELVAFPPQGFRGTEYRHRIGSGARRFDLAGRALMTWGAFRAAGFRVDDVQAEAASLSSLGTGPLFLDDGTPWITPGMTAFLTAEDAVGVTGPVKVLTVYDEPGRIGFVHGSMHGNPVCVERFLVVEHGADDAVTVTLRSLHQVAGGRFTPGARAAEARQRRLDERIVRALHPSYSG